MKIKIVSLMKSSLVLAVASAFAVSCGADKKSTKRSPVGVEVDDVGEDDATGKKKPNASTKDKSDDLAQDSDNSGEELPDVKTVMVTAGLRNYDQINATMSTLTGVPMSNPTISTAFKEALTGSLPTENDIKAFLGSNQVAVFKLAIEYCDVLVKDTNLRTSVFGDFNFAAAPATSLAAAGKTQLADALVTKFYGKDLSTLPPHDESVQMVEKVIDDLLVGTNANSAAVTPALVTGACTAVLSSAPVTMY